jgi:hypothetical protein
VERRKIDAMASGPYGTPFSCPAANVMVMACSPQYWKIRNIKFWRTYIIAAHDLLFPENSSTSIVKFLVRKSTEVGWAFTPLPDIPI